MGCGGSKAEANRIQENDRPNNNKPGEQKEEEDDEQDFQVLQPAKVVPKNHLDEVTIKSSVGNRTLDRNLEANSEVKLEEKETERNTLRHRETMDMPKPTNEEITIVNDHDRYRKAQTLADFARDNKHEFDFSFIDDKPKVDHDKDLLTDKILEEMSEI